MQGRKRCRLRAVFTFLVLSFIAYTLFTTQWSTLPPLEHSDALGIAIQNILDSSPKGEVGTTSATCHYRSLLNPFDNPKYFRKLSLGAQTILDSREYKSFAASMHTKKCDHTLAVRMERQGGQIGSHFNNEVLSTAVVGYLSNRTVIYDMSKSTLGRWCSFFAGASSCEIPPGSEQTEVELHEGVLPTDWMQPTSQTNHYSVVYYVGDILNYVLNWEFKKNGLDNANTLDLLRTFALYLWQLPDDLLDQLADLRKALGLNEKFVGVHVRWGDKIHEAGRTISAGVYAHYLRNLADKAGTKTIFVMSDTSEAVVALSTLLPGYQLKSTTPPSWKGNDGYAFFKYDLADREGRIRLLIAELSIMSEAEQVVCTPLSNVCRLLQQLRVLPHETLVGIDVSTSLPCLILKQGGWGWLEAKLCVSERPWNAFY